MLIQRFVTRALFLVGLLGATLFTSACPKGNGDTAPGRFLTAGGEKPMPDDPVAAGNGTALKIEFGEGVNLLGVNVPSEAKRGSQVEVTLWFQARAGVSVDNGTRVFVHGIVPGGQLRALGRDHEVAGGAFAGSTWKPGDILEDTFTVHVPRDFNADQVSLRIGLYNARDRFPVTGGQHDGENRVELAVLKVSDGPPTFPEVQAPHTSGAIKIDGVLDEADWKSAPRIGPFVRHDGRTVRKNKTYARLLWDAEALYIAFEGEDDDVHTPFEKRDDPLYNSEAVEIFIDADGDKDEYIELQAAPNDLHFDASFKGGSRKNFNTSYNIEYTTKTLVDGTLNEPNDKDKGFVSEWRVPFANINDIPEDRRAQDGVEWKINLFRLDRPRRGNKVVGAAATAWSSPFSGDFHNLERFGTLKFMAAPNSAP